MIFRDPGDLQHSIPTVRLGWLGVFFLSLMLSATPACGSSSTDGTDANKTAEALALSENSGAIKVVTTVSPITSIVENIGGTKIILDGVVPEGVNSHTFAPAPSVARAIAEADLIVLNGLRLEEPTLEMAQANKRQEAVILSLGDQAISREDWRFDFTFPEANGQPNPHLWPDPILALRYAELVQQQLAEMDPSNADYYADNLEVFRERIEGLDQRIAAAVATIPQVNRKLLTYHDSWAYFALRYGMDVIGAVQPSNFSQPSVKEVAELIDQLNDLKLPAVFGSEVFPSDVLETVAKESGAEFVDDLRDDDLPGGPGDPRHSYLGLMLENMEFMVPALGGTADALADFDPSLVFSGTSTANYPQ